MNESETRQKVIEQLEELKSEYQKRVSSPIYDGEEPRRKLKALDFAICSIKTDLKYDLLYEGKEIYTKADMVAMLTEIQLEIEEIPNSYEHKPIGTYDYCLGAEHERKVNLELIQQKIEQLKENNDV